MRHIYIVTEENGGKQIVYSSKHKAEGHFQCLAEGKDAIGGKITWLADMALVWDFNSAVLAGKITKNIVH